MRAGVQASRYRAGIWGFLRLLGVVYLFAFWSLHGQVAGLIGAGGILPVSDYLAQSAAAADAAGIGIERYRLLPTIFWISASDAALEGLAALGMVLAVLLAAGIAPALVLLLLWCCYLSLTVAGRDFLSFQWDGLLLETGLLAMLVCPWGWRHRPGDAFEPSPVARWLLWWLVLRLMFGSGFVKLASDDLSWSTLTAVAVHYETQPLPTPVAWYAAQLPLWFARLSTGVVLVVELIVPWFILAGVRPRRLAAVTLILLQLLIALTGNYGFFNLLTAALCVTLLDDDWLAQIRRWEIRRSDLQAGSVPRGEPAPQPTAMRAARRHVVPVAAAIVLVPISLLVFARPMRMAAPEPLQRLAAYVRPFRSVNGYGLFAVMTTTRPEVIIEGSMDGVDWQEYEFPYKPGATAVQPPWVAPFQPRLDWQMWFAALGRPEDEPWFAPFMQRLLDASPPVLDLLARDPFAGRRPRFVRATRYRYQFSPPGSEEWWTRVRIEEYFPPLSRTGNAAPRSITP